MKNSGIYIIKNTINNKIYLGSSTQLLRRKTNHFLRLKGNWHHNPYLQRAYNKYGKENFIFEVIFNCNEKDCIEYENYFLNLYQPDYNIAKFANAPMQGRKHSPETILKFKELERVKGEKHYLFGVKKSKEFCEHQRLIKTGTKHSPETRLKMKETAKRINSISRVDRTKLYKSVIDNDGIIYKTLTEAAHMNGISVQTVCDILKGRHLQTRKKKSFKYYE